MGGALPVGYRVENRALHVVEAEAEFVRTLFRRYLELGSVVRPKAALDAEGVTSPARSAGTGRHKGGKLLSRGHLYSILSNPIYIGKLQHKGQLHDGLHAPIVDREVWDRVQRRLAEQTQPRREAVNDELSFLAGKLFDDRGNRMTVSLAAKGSRRWRYYISRAALTGRGKEAGSIARVSAPQLEAFVIDAVKSHLASPAKPCGNDRRHGRSPNKSQIVASTTPASPSTQTDQEIVMAIESVILSVNSIEIVMADAAASENGNDRIVLPWAPESTRRKREIIQPADSNDPRLDRAMRPRARSVFVSAFSDARRWLDELVADPGISITSLAAREHKSERSIRLILSLAFLAPNLAKAAMEGNLPRGFKRARLVDLPMLWSDQWKAIGLQRPSSQS